MFLHILYSRFLLLRLNLSFFGTFNWVLTVNLLIQSSPFFFLDPHFLNPLTLKPIAIWHVILIFCCNFQTPFCKIAQIVLNFILLDLNFHTQLLAPLDWWISNLFWLRGTLVWVDLKCALGFFSVQNSQLSSSALLLRESVFM